MTVVGTFETFRDVRSPVANGGKAENICSVLSITGFDPMYGPAVRSKKISTS